MLLVVQSGMDINGMSFAHDDTVLDYDANGAWKLSSLVGTYNWALHRRKSRPDSSRCVFLFIQSCHIMFLNANRFLVVDGSDTRLLLDRCYCEVCNSCFLASNYPR